MKIGKTFKCSWEEVKIIRLKNNTELMDGDNGRSIGDLRFKNNETLDCKRRYIKPVPKVPLLDENSQMVPAFVKIVKSWFNQFAEDGKMTPKCLANFIHSCTSDFCKPNDRRVKTLF